MEPNFARIEKVKEATRRRVLAAASAAPEEVAALLRVIAERLFCAGFDASALRREVRPTRRAERAFKAATGFTLGSYLFEQRMRAAQRLLETTSLPVYRIAREICAVTERKLSSTFRRWAGKTPGEVREAAGRRSRRSPEERDRVWRLWLRTGLYALDEGESREARALNRAQRAALGRLSDEAWPRLWVEKIEAWLATRGAAETRRLCARLGLTKNAARSLFEALGERSRTAGRMDRRRGVELAEVALGVGEGCGVGEVLGLGWARLGNARCVAADFEGAERAMREAERWVGEMNAVAKAEFLRLKGGLRLYQRRYTEAEQFLATAVRASCLTSDPLLEVDARQQRAALRWYQGRVSEGIPDLQIALERTPEDDLRRRIGSTQQLLLIYVVLEDFSEIAKLLPQARMLYAAIDDKPGWHQLQWIEALHDLSQGNFTTAEGLLLEARAGFAKLRDPGMRAVVSLDLALLYDKQGQASGVLEYASEALAALDSLNLPEAIYALDLLRRPLAEQRICRQILKDARCRLIKG